MMFIFKVKFCKAEIKNSEIKILVYFVGWGSVYEGF